MHLFCISSHTLHICSCSLSKKFYISKRYYILEMNMKLVFFVNCLNHHQQPVADELYSILGDGFRLVETENNRGQSNKGSDEDFSQRPYLIKAWESEVSYNKAKEMAVNSDVAVFGANSLEFEVLRMKSSSKLSFEMSERWLKRGWLNLLSPRLLKNQWYYHTLFYNKPIYKLCSSAFCAGDQYKLRSFKGRCYKWGYFPALSSHEAENCCGIEANNIRIMWCSRYLDLKHPEMPVLLADRLKSKGYTITIDMFGGGDYEKDTKNFAKELGVDDIVSFRGNIPNHLLMEEMRKHDIFLFTSDKNEGWGVVANESMGNGCALVASDAIGSAMFLIKDKVNGMLFKSPSVKSSLNKPDIDSLNSLSDKVECLLQNVELLNSIRKNAVKTIKKEWSPKNAAINLLQLIDDLHNGKESSIVSGPCSKALPIY